MGCDPILSLDCRVSYACRVLNSFTEGCAEWTTAHKK